MAFTASSIRLEADGRGGEYAVERVIGSKGELHVYLGRRLLGWCNGAMGSGPWDYPFPKDRATRDWGRGAKPYSSAQQAPHELI